LCVHTDATVVISLMTTLPGGVAPTTVMSAMRELSPLVLSAVDRPRCASR
jgi:hypothetical protein